MRQFVTKRRCPLKPFCIMGNILILVTLLTCKSTGNKIAEGDPNLPDFEMLTESIRVERFSNSKLLKGKGMVKTDCSGRACSAKEVQNLPLTRIRSFPKIGEWEIYAQTQESGKSLRDQIFVNYLDMVGSFDNDKRVGIWKAFHRDSKVVASEIPYSNGIRDGIQKNYGTDGKLTGEVPWKDDKKNGIAKSFHSSGQVLSETTWRDDKKDGAHFQSISLKGSIRKVEEGTFRDDKKHGEWKYFDTVGDFHKQTAIYNNGELNGKETNYHSNGNILSEGINRNDARVGLWKIYYPEGQIQGEGSYSPTNDPENKFKRTGVWKEYYRNGKVFGEGPRDHIRSGRWTFYYNNGQIRFRGIMMNEAMMESAEIFERDGRKVGEGKLFFSIINIDEEKDEIKASYRADIPHTYFHPNGKKRLVISSMTDAVEYDESGKEIGRGGADAQGRKNGCWQENGKMMFYALGNPRPTMTASACKR